MKIQMGKIPYAYQIKTIDSHTIGEPTRIVYDGFPELVGDTMMEKKKYLMEHYDFLRSALMLEPRGHRDMFGALLTEPVHDEADVGVIFMDSGGCLNMCGHGSIGTAYTLVEMGMVEVKEPYTEVVLDAPSGIIRTRVHVVNGRAVEVSILNVPSFLYEEGLEISIPGKGRIPFDISFGGSFFALVDAEAIHLSLEAENIEAITSLGMELLRRINRTFKVKHPYLDITTVDLVEFYSHTDNPEADMKNCVIFGNAQADRCPCGTGTSAKMAALYARGELGLNQEFIYESITGSLFKGMAATEVEIAGRRGIIPQITGSAYITGINTWVLDDKDPLEDLFDQKYAELMVSMDPKLSHYDRLLYLNQELFGLIEEKVPFNLVSHLYVNMGKERQNLLNRNRFYYKLIPQIIEEGQKTGEFKTSDTSENLAADYASLERGMIYDWCVQGGNYNLKERSRHLLPLYLKSLVV